MQKIYGEEYSPTFMERSARDAAWLLHEAEGKEQDSEDDAGEGWQDKNAEGAISRKARLHLCRLVQV